LFDGHRTQFGNLKGMTSDVQTSLEVAAVLHALADPVRLDLFRQLSQSDTAIACGRFDTSVAKSTLSHHFKILREAGIIATHREGGQALNVLRTEELDASFPGLLRAILPQARR
jgi:DNA-binding transcriptional ArsR family regulator